MKHLFRYRTWSPLAGSVLAVVAVVGLWPGTVHAQRWLQHVEVITPVQEQAITQVLLDTLASVILREGLALKRSPDDPAALSAVDLEENLLNDGLDFTSATHLFIGYRLQADQRRFSNDITHLYFIYRPAEMDAVDIPILYIDATEPAIQDVINNSGTRLSTNEASFVPFREQITFHKLPESTVVSISGKIIRDSTQAAAEKQRLLSTIQRFMFN
jgi:hypothetical protein